VLEVAGLRAGYGPIPVLHGCSFTIRKGEFVGILGHNGMGKTTLMRTVMGYLRAIGGWIRYEGEDITTLPTHQRARRGISLVPQGREIFPNLSARDNLRMGLLRRGRAEAAELDGIVAEFPRLRGLLDRDGNALSGGEQQLLAVARCLCAKPDLVLLDEPTEGIQPSIIDELVETFARIRRQYSLTMLLVEQNLDFITQLADRVLIIQKGQITRELDRAALTDAHLISEFLGFAESTSP
jgi:branched-chain amino acid transport system ATP-binding protein